MKRLIRRSLSAVAFVLGSSVSAVAFAGVPRPEAVLGFRPGEDYKLARYEQMYEYFRLVAESSDRVRLIEIGPSSTGKPMIGAIISSPENLARLDHYQSISRRLALARGLNDSEAKELAREGKAVVYIDSGLHATEVAPTQHSFELLYYLATDSTTQTMGILGEVILIVVPCANPDGMDIVADWYETNVGTAYEISPLPELYAKYVGHDNNRDWFMFTQAETQNIGKVIYHDWLPQIVVNHHQSAPMPARIFIPPFVDPVNPHIPPLVMRGIQLAGAAMAQAFAEQGKSGVISDITFSTWWNGGLRTAPYFHNMVGILTETALYRYATPKFYAHEDLPEAFGNGLNAREASTFYPNPWPGGWWRLRDAVEYVLTASLALLDVAARYKDGWLYNIYQMGRNSLEKGQSEAPYAFVIPSDQADPSTAAKLVQTLAVGAVEVHRAEEAFTAEGVSYPAGSYVLLASQPFRPHLLDLMLPQNHPDMRLYPGGPPKPPYDITGWTLPLSMGVDAVEIPSSFDTPLTRIERAEPPVGRVEGSGSVLLLDPRVNDSFIAINRLMKAGATVYRSSEAVRAGSTEWPAGTFVVTRARDVRTLAEELRLRVNAVSSVRGQGSQLKPPRLGLYRSWVPSMDEGWTRWLLEQFEFGFSTLSDAEIRKPGLRQRFDTIVIPAETSLEQLVEGHEPGTMPPRYEGGMSKQGVANLVEFVRAGGTLVALDQASELVVESFDIPVESALAKLEREDFYCPGSLLEIEVDSSHPVAYGMEGKAAAFFRRSQAFTLVADFQAKMGQVVAKYPSRHPLLSGWIHGADHLRNKAAVVDVAVGDGRVILIGFRCQFRGQTHGTFKLLFNALYYGSATPASLP